MTIPIAEQIAAVRDRVRYDEGFAAMDRGEGAARSLAMHQAILTILKEHERALAVVKAARVAWGAFTDGGAQLPVFRTDEHLPEGYWSPAGRMTDTAAMVPIRDALAAFDTARREGEDG